jgi:hypothetical protein
MLTGKAKNEFEKWLEKTNFEECPISEDYSFQPDYIGDFERLPFSMQYGVYVDFFDSVGITISCTFFTTNKTFSCFLAFEKKGF